MWPCLVTITDTLTGGKLYGHRVTSPEVKFDPRTETLVIIDGPREEELKRVSLHSIDPTGVTLSALVPPISGHGFAPDEVHIRLDFACE